MDKSQPVTVIGNAPVPTNNGGKMPTPSNQHAATLPGATAPNPPPLPNTTQVGPRNPVPVGWVDTATIMAQLLEIMATGGVDSFNATKAFMEAELAKIRAGQ